MNFYILLISSIIVITDNLNRPRIFQVCDERGKIDQVLKSWNSILCPYILSQIWIRLHSHYYFVRLWNMWSNWREEDEHCRSVVPEQWHRLLSEQRNAWRVWEHTRVLHVSAELLKNEREVGEACPKIGYTTWLCVSRSNRYFHCCVKARWMQIVYLLLHWLNFRRTEWFSCQYLCLH